MLIKAIAHSRSLNTPVFAPSLKIENLYEKILIATVPYFLKTFEQQFNKKKLSETDLSQNFGIVLDRYIKSEDLKLIVRDTAKDIYTFGANSTKMPDFMFFSSNLGAEIKPLYVVEAKRLPVDEVSREREYVYGYFKSGSPAGGIQRFKTDDHGFGLPQSALLGYVETKDFSYWHKTINCWINDKTIESRDCWYKEELLQNLEIDSTQVCSISHSIAYRKKNNDAIQLFHLWIKIPEYNEQP